MEAAQRFLGAKERFPVGSQDWARATAMVFNLLMHEACAEVAKPDVVERRGAQSRRCRRGYLVREAPDDGVAHQMRANVLCGQCNGAWETGPRSAAELKEAATHYERAAAALHPVPPPAAIKPCSPAARAGA